jgi:hypothetical protein
LFGIPLAVAKSGLLESAAFPLRRDPPTRERDRTDYRRHD